MINYKFKKRYIWHFFYDHIYSFKVVKVQTKKFLKVKQKNISKFHFTTVVKINIKSFFLLKMYDLENFMRHLSIKKAP